MFLYYNEALKLVKSIKIKHLYIFVCKNSKSEVKGEINELNYFRSY